tara:strand:+ start:1157 stop:1600 length:444 start_codon:yes stop_codon:yes gene_type:complete
MFAVFNENNFPIINCVFSKTVENNRDFSDFLQKWIEFYDNKKDFIFIFDTKNVEDVPLRYSFKMAIFIKELKKRPYHYLQKSIIIVNSKKVKYLLDFIFLMQSPVAPVYILYTDKVDNTQKINNILNGNIDENVTQINPGISFLPFL